MNRYFVSAAMLVGVVGTVACGGSESSEQGTRTQGAITAAKSDPTQGNSTQDKGSGTGDSAKACFTIDVAGACSSVGDKNSTEDPAQEICTAKRATLTDVKSSPSGCSVTCCPLPAPDPASCRWSVVGDGHACISLGDLKVKAVALCDAQKAEVRSFENAADCAGGATAAKVECCVPDPKSSSNPGTSSDPTQPTK